MVAEKPATAITAPPMPAGIAPPPRAAIDRYLAGGTPAWVSEYNRSTTWSGLLERDGWTLGHTDGDGVQHWARPGKDAREGTSATVDYAGLDCLYVYTTSIPWLPSDTCCDRFGYMVRRDYRGDFKAAADALKPSRARRIVAATGEILEEMVSTTTNAARAVVSRIRHGDEAPAIHLPDEFYAARPILQQVEAAAYSRTLSRDAVFHCVLARIAGSLPPGLNLPPTVGTAMPLSYCHAAVGPPGSGKTGAAGVARELVPVGEYVADSLPVGSGEGMAEVLFDVVTEPDPDTGKAVKVKRQVRHNAIVYVDEGEALTALGSRSGVDHVVDDPFDLVGADDRTDEREQRAKACRAGRVVHVRDYGRPAADARRRPAGRSCRRHAAAVRVVVDHRSDHSRRGAGMAG